MKITKTEIYKLTIPMEPFVIATETSYFTQNVFIRIHTDDGLIGMGECSAFPMLVGETQNTCFEVAKDLARIISGKNPVAIQDRMNDLHEYIAFNSTVKSAFDIAFHDLAAKAAGQPLYKFLGGKKKSIQTDLTIGIESPANMANTAKDFIARGVKIIKIKLGKRYKEDVERVRLIREAVGNDIRLRTDANQGWTYDEALYCLQHMAPYNIEFCEQPMRQWNDPLLPQLRSLSPIKIMADESVFDHYDAIRLIEANACDYINIKLAKSGGILEAKLIADEAQKRNVPCMLGGMIESRLALTAKVHLAMSHDNIQFYDLDTCLLGHKLDPVIGGAQYNNFFLELPDGPGIDADIDPNFLESMEKVVI
ncbi:MAG: dipeptide epimerase [Chitinophagaceae bacterium]|nr:dipeptide epimerase [Chitinophagaceae bacterium]